MRLILLLAASMLGRPLDVPTGVPSASQIGRFPVLAPLGSRSGRCRSVPTSPELRNQGIWRMTMLELDGDPARSFAVSTNARGGIAAFTSFYSVQAGPRRREGENVIAFYAPDETLRSGSRRYQTTGTPARISEDRSAALSTADAAAAFKLAKAVLARCGS